MLTGHISLGDPKVYNYFATAVDNCTHRSLNFVISLTAFTYSSGRTSTPIRTFMGTTTWPFGCEGRYLRFKI